MLRIDGGEVRPAHRGELRVVVAATRPAGLGQVRGYLAADLIRRYTERIGLAPSVIDFSPGNEKELRAACDALNIHPPRHTLALPPRPEELAGLFPDGVRAPVFDIGVRNAGEPLPDEAAGLAGRWLDAAPAEADMTSGGIADGGIEDGEGVRLGEEPLSVRMKMLGVDGDPAATLGRWRRRVAQWARSPSGAMSRPHADAIGAAFEDGLDAAAALRVLADLEADGRVPDGVKFETFAAADRLFGLDLARDIGKLSMTDLGELARGHSAHNYAPLPVMVASASGAWVTDTGGRRYLDMLAGYSALNFGHRHPRLIAAARRQLDRVTLVSRAFDHDQFEPFCAELAELCGMEMVLPVNTGAEAVETAIKVARKWGYSVKGVPDGEALIVVFDGNFHGRTTTIVSFSSDPDARADFGPYTPGFVPAPYGDLDSLKNVFAEHGSRIVAVLIEPIQGEAGVVVPPPGFLAGVRALCSSGGALMIADEIQSGLGRAGATFACSLEGVTPDAYLLGKALGGGIVPVSAMVSSRSVLGVLKPGQHGSTFGGNPLACAVAREVIALLRSGELQERSASLGIAFHARLAALASAASSPVSSVTGRGLWAGVTFGSLSGRSVCERLASLGVLAKEAHGSTIRLAPPLIIGSEDLSWGLDRLGEAVEAIAEG